MTLDIEYANSGLFNRQTDNGYEFAQKQRTPSLLSNS
jgi:hypothetical protein